MSHPARTAAPDFDTLMVDPAGSIRGTDTLEAGIRPLLELLETATGFESTCLTTVDPDAATLHVVCARHSGRLQIPKGEIAKGESTSEAGSLCRRALAAGRSHRDGVAGCCRGAEAARELDIATYLTTPVRTADGQLYGTLCAASTQPLSRPSNTSKLLDLIANLIGQHVERERLLAKLRQANSLLATQALIDPLTGLPNRRAVQMELTRMLARRARAGQRLLVAFIDLDDFKAVNDRYGHDIGDALLVAIGLGLAETLRAGDLVARYGGDEFMVVAPAPADADSHNAAQFQQLLTARTRVQVPLDDGMPDDRMPDDRMLTYPGASVGVILTEPGELDTDAVIARADAAMYLIKQARGAPR